MRTFLFPICAAGLLGLFSGCGGAATKAAAPAPDAAAARPTARAAGTTSAPHVLVFTRTTGFRHDSIPVGVQAVRELAAQAGLQVEHSEDPNVFGDEGLHGVRAVVFLSTTGDVLDAAQQAAFERYIAAGGGWLGIHAAADTEYDWPWYGTLLGGAWFDSHPPGLQGTHVRFEGAQAGLADGWRVTDELYNYKRNPRDRVQVLATVDERGYAGGKMGDDHPIAWCAAIGNGRGWYTGLGHDAKIYADPTYRAHLLRGLRYASGLSGTC